MRAHWMLNFIIFLVIVVSEKCDIYGDSLQELCAYQLVSNDKTKSVYIFGGLINVRGIIYKWDTSDKNEWFEQIDATLPTDYFYSFSNNAVIINNTIFFIGVYDGLYNSGNIYTFDMQQDKFITNTLPKPQYPSTMGCLSTNNTHIFMIGGATSNSHAISYIQIYDISNQQWSTSKQITLSPVNNGWTQQYCSMVHETQTLYIFGGLAYGGTGNFYIDGIYKYDVIPETLTHIDNLPIPSGNGFAVYSSKYNLIYLVGGYNTAIYENGSRDIGVFNVDTEKYIYAFNMTVAVWDASASILNDKLLIFGGCYGNGNQELRSVQVCDLSVRSTEPSGSERMTWWEIVFLILLALFMGIIFYVLYRCWRKRSQLNNALNAAVRYGAVDEQGQRLDQNDEPSCVQFCGILRKFMGC